MAKNKQSKHAPKTVLKSGAGIGLAAAEDDAVFLAHCFVSSPQYAAAISIENQGSVLLGRTGSGKSAMLKHIEDNFDNVIRINPENLALQYISNSNIISFFASIGVELDLFFQLLWRHVICVELINYRYHVMDRTDSEKVVDTLRSLLGRDAAKKLALEYLEKWGSSFWQETHSRVVEIVGRFEEQLEAGTKLGALGLSIAGTARDSVSEEQKVEIVREARKVVSEIQLQHLSVLMNSLNEDILKDKNKKYYIVIDDLDLFQVSDLLRYRIIRALIETIKAFKKVMNVKIIISMRSDLIEQVYKHTRSPGFQEEKYSDLNIKIQWTDAYLRDLVQTRISYLFKSKYTKENVAYDDIFPSDYRQYGSSFSYLIQRAQSRPRDIIAFVNLILEKAVGKTQVTASDIDEAEYEYSHKRVAALASEWSIEHPFLEEICGSLRNYPSRFSVSEMRTSSLEELAMTLLGRMPSPDGMVRASEDFLEERINDQTFRRMIFAILYKVGVVGLKPSQAEPVFFSYSSTYTPNSMAIEEDFRVSVSPMVWRAFNIVKGRKMGEIVS